MAVHPLMQFEPTAPIYWQNWLTEWKIAGNFYTSRRGLIETGFEARAGGQELAERICLYLELADGWYNGFESMADDQVTINRKQLSRLALSVLSAELFHNTESDHRSWPWLDPSWPDQFWQIWETGVVEKLLWFFRTDESLHRIPNLGRRDSGLPNQGLQRFLKEFVDYLWLGHYACPVPVETYRPQLIQILAGTYRLKILLDPKYTLDESCWEELRRLAYSEHPDTSDRPLGRVFFEANFPSARDAAQVLIIRGIVRDERARADERRDLQQKVREAQTRLDHTS